MHVKRFVLFAFVVLVAVSFAAAAGQSGSGTSDAGYTLTPRGTLPIAEGSGAVLTLYTHGNMETDYSKNYFLEWFTPISNVELQLSIVTTEQYKEKLNLLFASGDAPDIIAPGNNSLTYWSTGEQMNALDQGLILPIEDLIKDHSTNFIKFLNSPEFDGLREAITAPGGHITGMPDIGSCYHCFYSQKMNVNQKWLDNLGLDWPETPEEFKDMLIAFRDKDANGNGDPNDEVPLAFAKGGAMVQLDGYLMSPWEYSPAYFDRLSVNDNGEVYAAYVTDAYREGLKYLKDLWDENLIYKESFVQDRKLLAQMNAMNEGDEYQKLGAVPAMHKGYYIAGDASNDFWREWIAIPPLKNSDGERLAINYESAYRYNPGYKAFINADAKDPVLAFRYIDSQWDGWFGDGDDYDVNKIASMGILGETWAEPAPGAVGYDGLPATQTRMPPLEDDHPYFNNATFSYLSGPIKHSGWEVPAGMTYMDDHPSAYEQYLWQVTDDNYAPYKQDFANVLPRLFISPENAQIASQYEAQIKSFVEESVASFVSGSRDVYSDGDWAAYKKELNGFGLQDYLGLYQEAYDAQFN